MSDHQPHNILPRLAIIVAMTRNRATGSEKGLPWDIPQDLQLFKQLTHGSTVIMGRRTYESIGHPLPNRHNIVLSRRLQRLPDVQVCNGFMTALGVAWRLQKPIFILGGSEVFLKALPIANELHISWIKQAYSGDCFFPPFDLSEWCVCAKQDYLEFQYVHYRRYAPE